jgi:hypothetical protein
MERIAIGIDQRRNVDHDLARHDEIRARPERDDRRRFGRRQVAAHVGIDDVAVAPGRPDRNDRE